MNRDGGVQGRMRHRHFFTLALTIALIEALPVDIVSTLFGQWNATIGRCPSLYGSGPDSPGLFGTYHEMKGTCSGKKGPLCAAALGVSFAVCEIHQRVHEGDLQADKVRLPPLPTDADAELICSSMVEPNLQSRLRYHVTQTNAYKSLQSSLSGFLASNNTRNKCLNMCSEPEVEGLDPDKLTDENRKYLCKTVLKGLQTLAAVWGPAPGEAAPAAPFGAEQNMQEVPVGGPLDIQSVDEQNVKEQLAKIMDNPVVASVLNKSENLKNFKKAILESDDSENRVIPAPVRAIAEKSSGGSPGDKQETSSTINPKSVVSPQPEALDAAKKPVEINVVNVIDPMKAEKPENPEEDKAPVAQLPGGEYQTSANKSEGETGQARKSDSRNNEQANNSDDETNGKGAEVQKEKTQPEKLKNDEGAAVDVIDGAGKSDVNKEANLAKKEKKEDVQVKVGEPSAEKSVVETALESAQPNSQNLTETKEDMGKELVDNAMIPGGEADREDVEVDAKLEEQIALEEKEMEYVDKERVGLSPVKLEEKAETKPRPKAIQYYEDNTEESNFTTMLLTFIAITLLGYIAFHNKHRIIAVMIEGRRRRPAGRGRFANTSYKKLDTTFDDAVSSNRNVGRLDVIY